MSIWSRSAEPLRERVLQSRGQWDPSAAGTRRVWLQAEDAARAKALPTSAARAYRDRRGLRRNPRLKLWPRQRATVQVAL